MYTNLLLCLKCAKWGPDFNANDNLDTNTIDNSHISPALDKCCLKAAAAQDHNAFGDDEDCVEDKDLESTKVYDVSMYFSLFSEPLHF